MSTLLLRTHWHHPEWVAVLVAAVGWAVLLAAPTGGAGPTSAGTHGWAAVGLAGAMAAAMMAPVVLPQVHDVAVSSLWARRYRAALGYLSGYLAVWTAAAVVLAAAGRLLASGVGTPGATAVAFGAAALAPLGRGRRRRLTRCEVLEPLALRGWPADRDVLRAGGTAGGRCVATCWALMAAVMLHHALPVLAAATVLTVVERRRPGLDPRTVALAVVVLGVASGLLVLVGAGPGLSVGTGTHSGH